MNSKEKLSITNQFRIRYFLHGCTWIIAGVFKFFDNSPCRIICSISLAISVFLLVKFMFANRELKDEMAEQNLYKAKAAAMDLFRIGICVVLLIFVTLNRFFDAALGEVNIYSVIVPILFIEMGIENLLIGVYFNHFDKE